MRSHLLRASIISIVLAGVAAAAPTTRPGELSLIARSRAPIDQMPGQFRVVEKTLNWEASQTALIIIDVWDKHWCAGANRRLALMLDRMNRTVETARAKGVLIIHAPSDCMETYKDAPQRRMAQQAPRAADLPKDITKWCSRLPKGEPSDPIDSSDGGCDDQPRCKDSRAWKSEHPAIRIADGDAISDKGEEVWNLLAQRGIKNVMVMGVHTNMCILGRPFGLRNLSRYGKNAVLIRDLTDTMYNPRKAPLVSHDRGTALEVEHVEKYVCPSILSDEILGEQHRPAHVLFMIGEDEYSMAKTLPEFARSELEKLSIRCTFATAADTDTNNFRGMEDAKDVDLIVVGVRRRAPKKEQMNVLRRHLEEGKPLIGLRTASHAFAPRGRVAAANATWPSFDVDVLGARYDNHYDNGVSSVARLSATAASHPIVAGWPREPVKFTSSLYQYRDVKTTAVPLLFSTIENGNLREPVAWTNTYKGGRVFYTSLGSAEDFRQPAFRRMLVNAVLWALDRPMPAH